MNDRRGIPGPNSDPPELAPAGRAHGAGAGFAKVLLLAATYLAIVVLGLQLGGWIGAQLEFEFYLSPRTERAAHRMLLLVIVVYVALMSVPFVPGIEIGLALMALFGGEIALLVYLSTVLALTFSFIIGRLIPERALIWTLERLHLHRARSLVSHLEPMPGEERLCYLLERSSGRAAFPSLLKYRYLTIAVALNVPGNALIGGGGGIGLAAGMCRLFTFPAYLLTICLAVAPVPLAVAFTDAL